MRKFAMAAAVVAALGAAGSARAQGAGYHEHDGFFLQMDLGLGSQKSSASLVSNSWDLSGTGSTFSLVLGGAVAPNLILGGHLWAVGASQPTFKRNGNTLQSYNDDAASLGAFGLNVTYYLMPYNVYFQATPSVAAVSMKQAGVKWDSKSGFAIRIAVGKEWWLSDNWGLGLDLQYAHASTDMKDVPVTFATNWFGLALSATYN